MTSRFLHLLLCLLLAGCAGLGSQQAAAPHHIRLLQINDTYKIEGLENGQVGGLARVRTLRKQLEADGTPVLVLHAGDLLFPSVVSKYLKGGPMVQTLNLMDGEPKHFDPHMIATLGNHEFDDSDSAVLFNRLAQSEFTWTSANVLLKPRTDAPAGPVSILKNTLLLDVGGVRVGLFGLTLDVTQPPYASIRYSPESARREVAAKALADLRSQGAQIIIALTHQNLEEDIWLAREFPDINVVAGGHEHFFIQRRVGDTWITKADADAASAVVYDIELAGSNGRVTANPHKQPLTETVVPDPAVAQAVDAQLAQFAETFKQATGEDLHHEIGRTLHRLEGVEPAVRGRETALGNLLADVIRERMKADVGVINGGSIRINDNIPPGPITAYDLAGIFYYDNKLVLAELSGEELLAMLRNSVSRVHVGDGRFLQVSGLRFRYHVNTQGEPLSIPVVTDDVEIAMAHGYAPLQLRKRYRVAMTDFLWNRGREDGYGPFSQPRLDKGNPIGLRQAFLDALAGLPGRTVTTDIEGRIVRVEDRP